MLVKLQPRIPLLVRVALQSSGSSALDGAGTSTGIEHALKYKKMGEAHKSNFEQDYKCIEYLHQNKYSYYDRECELHSFRVAQPTNKAPDVEPKCKA